MFAVAFGMGVVSGLVMAYQFGTNWSGFSRFAGGITGPLLAYEVLTAFFLEAGFLGVMLFGWNRVGPRPAFPRDDHGGPRHAHLDHLDPRRPTAGCRRPRATTSSMVAWFPSTGWR